MWITCPKVLACSTIILASAVSPLTAHPTCESISNIFSTLSGTIRGDASLLSTARTIPSFVRIPIEVEPS